jgi:hypothetical protein
MHCGDAIIHSSLLPCKVSVMLEITEAEKVEAERAEAERVKAAR